MRLLYKAAHIGVDSKTGLVHTVKAPSANVHDVTKVSELLTGEEEFVYGDSGYLGAEKRENAVIKNNNEEKIKHKINRRPSQSEKFSKSGQYKAKKSEHQRKHRTQISLKILISLTNIIWFYVNKNISIEKIFTANYPIKYSVMCKRITSYNFCAVFPKNHPYARKSNTCSERSQIFLPIERHGTEGLKSRLTN